MNGFALWDIVVACPLAYILTGAVRSYTLRVGILDIPNARSSHTHVTPRGGGLAIAILFLGGVGVLTYIGVASSRVGIALFGGGLMVSCAGWIDDRLSLSAGIRAGIHVIAAIWALLWLGGLPQLRVGFAIIPFGALGWALGVLGIVWLTNLYNFMDGIDGLAGAEAVSVGVVLGALEMVAGAQGLAMLAWLLASVSAGFLFWNWPPAKIFMGDVSSGLMGFTLGVLATASENDHALPLLVWFLLLGVFLVDATATLLRRIRRGERWYEPHRAHAYQLAVQGGYTHKQVTLAVLGMNAGLALLAVVALEWQKWMLLPMMLTGIALVLLQNTIVRRYEFGDSRSRYDKSQQSTGPSQPRRHGSDIPV